MKFLIFLSFFSITQITFAQKFNFPKLLSQSDKVENVIPKNWEIIDSVAGDLNSDRINDLVLVLEYNTAIEENRAYGNFEIELIKEVQRPRMLAIYFKQPKTYKLAVQNNDFILRSEEGGQMGDPLKGLRIENNSLTISFEGGNDWRWKLNYQFTYHQKEWQLTAANNVYYHKDKGDMVDKQYDFVDRTIRTVVGSIFNRNILNYKDEDILIFGSARTLKDFKKPWTWEISKDNYL
jgi:hypothetical protein